MQVWPVPSSLRWGNRCTVGLNWLPPRRVLGGEAAQWARMDEPCPSLFWPRCVACAILVPWAGTEPGPWQWKHGLLTTGRPGNSLSSLSTSWFALGHKGLSWALWSFYTVYTHFLRFSTSSMISSTQRLRTEVSSYAPRSPLPATGCCWTTPLRTPLGFLNSMFLRQD